MEENNPRQRPLNYKLYYDPELDFRTVAYKHDSPPGQYIRALRDSIAARGLQNPVMVTYQNGAAWLHPGRCRIAALIKLDRRTVPAIIVDYSNDYKGKGKAITKEEAQSYLTGDCVVRACHRFFTIDKRPTKGRVG